MKILSLLFLICCSNIFFAQILADYPIGQTAYQGKAKQLYNDIHEILNKDYKPCENKNELILLKILVDEKGDATFLENSTENKCANDLAKNVVSRLDKWIPAEVAGNKVSAIATYIFFPDDLLENYREDYSVKINYVEPQFPGGINKFREDFMRNVTTPNSKKDILRFVVRFDLDKFGAINNINIQTTEQDTEKFQKRIIKAIENIETKWIPAKYKGNSIDAKFRLPVTIQFQ